MSAVAAAPPDFVIAGAPKSGTTWLYRNLAANPEVFLAANKEPRYFSVEEGAELIFHGPGDDDWLGHFVRDGEAYNALFEGAGEGRLRGEASSDYLYRASVAAPRIAAAAPRARLVFLLRDPVERAHSNWLHHRRDGREPFSFAAALDAESKRIEAGWAWWWHYVERGYYARGLASFLEHFPAEQIFVAPYEEIAADPRDLLRRVSAFLGVEAVIPEAIEVSRNESLVPRSPAHRAVRRVLRPNAATRALLPRRVRGGLRRRVERATVHRPEIAAAERDRLRRVYATDSGRLGELVGLDLSRWGT